MFHPRNVCHTLLADFKRSFDELNPTLDVSNSAPYSQYRKEWKAHAEDVLVKLERSSACMHFTPTEIAMGALMISEPKASNVAAESPYNEYHFQNYLRYRFGSAEGTVLLERTSKITRLLTEVDEAEANEAEFKKITSYVKKRSVWGGKKEKSRA